MKFDLQWFAEDALKNQTPNQIRKGIRSLNKEIKLHLEKIDNPEKSCVDWNSRNERAKKGLIRHWKKEIEDMKKSIQNRIEELKKRGEKYE